MQENFLQESIGRDKVKIYSWAFCLGATRYTHYCNRDKVNLLSLFFPSSGTQAPQGLYSLACRAYFAYDLFLVLSQNICALVFLSQMQSAAPPEPGKALPNPTPGTWAGDGWHQGRGHPLGSSISKIQIPIWKYISFFFLFCWPKGFSRCVAFKKKIICFFFDP